MSTPIEMLEQEMRDRLAEKNDRIAEMKRRESLLTDVFVNVQRWMVANDEGSYAEADAALLELAKSQHACDWLDQANSILLPEAEAQP